MTEKTIALELETWGDVRIWTVRETGHEPDEDGITDPVADMIPEHGEEQARMVAIQRGQRVGWRVLETREDGKEVVGVLWDPLVEKYITEGKGERIEDILTRVQAGGPIVKPVDRPV